MRKPARKAGNAKPTPKPDVAFEHSPEGWKERAREEHRVSSEHEAQLHLAMKNSKAIVAACEAEIARKDEEAAAARLRNAALAWELEHAKRTIATLSRLLAGAAENLFEAELARLKSDAQSNVASAA